MVGIVNAHDESDDRLPPEGDGRLTAPALWSRPPPRAANSAISTLRHKCGLSLTAQTIPRDQNFREVIGV